MKIFRVIAKCVVENSVVFANDPLMQMNTLLLIDVKCYYVILLTHAA